VDGVDLGPPVLLDGYAAGWRVDLPGTTHTARIWYGPQRVTDAGLAVSAASVLGCLVVFLLRAPPPSPVVAVRRRAFSRPGRVVGWAAVVAVAFVLGGVLLAVAAAVLAGWHLVRPPAPGVVIIGAAVALAVVPVVWLAFRPDLGGALSAGLVTDNLWPHRFAAVGLLLLAVGVLRSERRGT
jgi:hypothetical protein